MALHSVCQVLGCAIVLRILTSYVSCTSIRLPPHSTDCSTIHVGIARVTVFVRRFSTLNHASRPAPPRSWWAAFWRWRRLTRRSPSACTSTAQVGIWLLDLVVYVRSCMCQSFGTFVGGCAAIVTCADGATGTPMGPSTVFSADMRARAICMEMPAMRRWQCLPSCLLRCVP